MKNELKPQYLIINNHHDYGCNQYYFKVIQNVGILEDAFLSAVNEFYHSSAGKEIPREITRNFGWSNVIEAIPTSVWEKYGLVPVQNSEYCLLEFDDIRGENILGS